YTALLDTDLEPSTVGQLTAVGHGRLIMLIGNLLVMVEQPQLASKAALRELAGILRKSADTTPLPPIRAYLPQGFANGTQRYALGPAAFRAALSGLRSEEHTSELQSRGHLVCRLLPEKKKGANIEAWPRGQGMWADASGHGTVFTCKDDSE